MTTFPTPTAHRTRVCDNDAPFTCRRNVSTANKCMSLRKRLMSEIIADKDLMVCASSRRHHRTPLSAIHFAHHSSTQDPSSRIALDMFQCAVSLLLFPCLFFPPSTLRLLPLHGHLRTETPFAAHAHDCGHAWETNAARHPSGAPDIYGRPPGGHMCTSRICAVMSRVCSLAPAAHMQIDSTP